MDAKKQVEKRIKEAGGVMQLAAKTGMPRQNIYSVRRGAWPSATTACSLKLRLVLDGKL